MFYARHYPCGSQSAQFLPMHTVDVVAIASTLSKHHKQREQLSMATNVAL